MKTKKELKEMLESKVLERRVIVNVVININHNIKYVKNKIKEYQELLLNGKLEDEKYLDQYLFKLEELRIKRKVILESLGACEIVYYNYKYYLKYYIRFSLKEDYMFYNRISEKDIYLYPNLKIKKRRVIAKKYLCEKYTTQFCNKVFDLINQGELEIR